MIECAKKTLDERGFGMASAPLMSGQQDLHKLLEQDLSDFHGTDKTVIFPSGYHANLGWFATLFNQKDVIISDQLNHASIIDGIKLSKCDKVVYKHLDNDSLEEKLKETQGYRRRCVVTEGVFSMDADIVDLKRIVKLCKKYNAVLFLDDCHGVAIIGKSGRGTPEYCGVPMEDIDGYIATMGKGLSGGGGGYITGSYPIMIYLKQRCRTYIFSNALPPTTVNGAREALRIFNRRPGMFEEHRQKAHKFRSLMRGYGFEILGNDDCPICPVFLKDEIIARKIELELLGKGVYTILVAYPVIQRAKARMRCIITMGHTDEMIEKAAKAFKEVADENNYWEYIKVWEAKQKQKSIKQEKPVVKDNEWEAKM